MIAACGRLALFGCELAEASSSDYKTPRSIPTWVLNSLKGLWDCEDVCGLFSKRMGVMTEGRHAPMEEPSVVGFM